MMDFLMVEPLLILHQIKRILGRMGSSGTGVQGIERDLHEQPSYVVTEEKK